MQIIYLLGQGSSILWQSPGDDQVTSSITGGAGRLSMLSDVFDPLDKNDLDPAEG